ncbi:MAG: hypothetical protein N2C12_17885 [Planctomycetales bacterium]
MTNVSVVTGPDTPFDESRTQDLKEMDEDTIILVEVRDSGVHWAQPWDLDLRTMPSEINPTNGTGISGNFDGGFFVGFADGKVWFLDNDIPFDQLKPFLTLSGARELDREEVLEPYKIAE